MTDNQRKYLYFPAWHRCAQALGWVMRNGRLVADLAEQEADARMYCRPAEHSPGWDERLAVIASARQLARLSHRAVTAEDLRHACNLRASDLRTQESGKLKQPEISRAVNLFDLLRDPEGLNAINTYLDPHDAERRSFVRFLERQDARTIGAMRAIAGERWPDATPWNFRDLDDLKWLWSQVRGRRQSAVGRVQKEKVVCPF